MKRVLIIPGHGGKDPGCSGVSTKNGTRIKESKLNLNVAMGVKSKLEATGKVYVEISRTSDDVYLSPSQQLALANKGVWDVVLLIHHNAGKGKGYEVLWNKESDRLLALEIAKQFKALNTPHNGGVVNSPRSLAFDKCKWPCAYTEFAYLDTPSDMALVDTLDGQNKESNAIAYGTLVYLGLV